MIVITTLSIVNALLGDISSGETHMVCIEHQLIASKLQKFLFSISCCTFQNIHNSVF